MQAMQAAAATDSQIAARIDLFRYRVPEELYDLENDPDCLFNLIDDPESAEALEQLQARLQTWMEATGDPMLEAFLHRTDRDAVDAALLETYGPVDPKLIRLRESR